MRLLLLGLLLLGGAHPASAQILPNFGEDRAGSAGFQFLKVPVDARSAALGEAAAATTTDASALLINPALAARAPQTAVALGLTRYFADTRLYYLAGLTHVGAFALGISVHGFDAGTMDVTTEFEPFGTGQTFGFSNLAVGVTAAQALTDLFSYGVTLKLAQETTAGLTSRTGLVDLGAAYRVGDTGTRLGVAIRHFGLDGRTTGAIDRPALPGGTATEDRFSRLTPPTTFLLGVSYDVRTGNPEHALTLAGQLTKPNDFAERFSLGAEYRWNDLLTLRAGYAFGQEEATWPTVGLGLHVPDFGPALRLDYAFSTLDRLGDVHRVGLAVSL